MYFITLTVFAASFAVSFLIHVYIFNLSLYQYLGASLTLSFVVSLTVPIIFVTYPLYRGSQRGKEIDANLVYTTGYMAILSAGNIPVERIFEQVIEVETCSAIKNLAKRFMTNVKMLGLDVTSALNEIAARSPSEILSRLLAGITNTAQTSGDLKNYLIFETQRLLHLKREQGKKTIGTLTILAEIYVTAIIMAPVIFIVMLTLLSILGNVAFGLSPTEQMNLLVFFGLPMISLVFIVILNSIIPKEE